VLSEIPLVDHSSPVLQAYSCYRSLVSAAAIARAAEDGLGGKLLYLGELDEQGCAIAIAGNVAGCATLAATADPDMQKQAIRDGIVDFLVTSLDEALRILKNEIRKHSTVAVCVGVSPSEIEREMLERGVQPDLSRQSAGENRTAARICEQSPSNAVRPMQAEATVMWSVESQPRKWLPTLDAIAFECLQVSDVWNRRWIQCSPRYLGRLGSQVHLVRSDREFAASFVESVRSAFQEETLAATATIWVASEAGPEIHNFAPSGNERATPPAPPLDSTAL